MIYLIGVNHDIQFKKEHNLFGVFKPLLINLIIDCNIKCVAEEWSNEASNKWGVNDSNIKELVKEVMEKFKVEIDHRYVDPNTKERENAGIKDNRDLIKQHGWGINILSPEQRLVIQEEEWKEFQKRENMWINRITDKINGFNVVFICGTQHISLFNKVRSEGFDTLLSKLGYEIEVIPERFDEFFEDR